MNALHFLITLFFDLSVFVLWIRIALRYLRVSTLHPIGQPIYQLTDPIVTPLQRFINPQNKSPYDWVALGLILSLELVKFILIGLLFNINFPPISYLVLFVFCDVIIQVCNILFYIILFRVIMSWVNPTWKHPALDIIRSITDPMFESIRRILPPTSTIDFSPFILLVALEVITLLLRPILHVTG